MTNSLVKESLLGNYRDHEVKEPIRIRTDAFKDTRGFCLRLVDATISETTPNFISKVKLRL